MRKIHTTLRLFFEAGLSIRAVARTLRVSPEVPAKAGMGEYLRRAQVAGLSWPLPEGMDERALEARLFPGAGVPAPARRAMPDWAHVHTELRRKGVTLSLLWQEYKAEHPDGIHYSRFCERYRAFRQHLDGVMRQSHRAGEKLFVDYAGHTAPVVDRESGELHQAQVFVAVLGASSYTYAEATWTQTLPDWCASHVRTLQFLGGVPECVVPDNLRSAVSRAHPPAKAGADLNPTYADLAEHYGFVVIPARVRRPRDKAKAEVAVQLVERWILAALRHRTFFSLAELNRAIAGLLGRLNERPFHKLPGSRRSAFESIDRPALRALPPEPYVFAQWKKVRVHVDSHIELDRHYYSVPHPLAGRPLLARYTAHTVELLDRGQRVASHRRSHQPGRHTTLPEHMPEPHRRFAQQWSPERFSRWAESIGPATAALITDVLHARRHPEHSYRACLGILRLAKTYSHPRLEAAAQRALTLGTRSVRSIESIPRFRHSGAGLKHRLDEQAPNDPPELPLPADHDNLRAPSYFH